MLLLGTLSPAAWAHSVHVDAFVEIPGAVTIEAYFGDGKPVAEATVRVRDRQDREILAAVTDAQGRYVYKPASAEPVTIEVLQAAHRGVARIDGELIAEALGQPAPAGGASSQASGSTAAPTAPSVRERTRQSNLPAALAGMALILAAAALWQTRTLSRRVDRLAGERKIEE